MSQELQLKEIPEAEASEELRTIYRDIEHTLQVPFVPWPFRALAVYEKFFQTMWKDLKPTITSQLEDAADELRSWLVERLPQALPGLGSDHQAKLREKKLSQEQIEKLQGQVHVYHYLDPKLALLVAALHEALEGKPVGVRSIVVWPTSRGVPAFMPRVGRVEPTQASGAVAKLFEEVRQALELPAVPDEYRTLAQWPEYLELAWGEIKAMLQSEGYSQLLEELRSGIADKLKGFRRRLDLSTEELSQLGLSEPEQQDIRQKIELFDRALPGLTIQVGYLALALLGPEEAKLDSLALMRRWALPKP